MRDLNKILNSKKIAFSLYTAFSLIYFYNPLLTGKLLGGSDYLLGGYAAREWLSMWLRRFYLPLWFPFERAGYGIIEAFWMDIFTPTGFLRLLLPTHIHFNFSFFFYTLLAGFGTYLFLRELKIKPLFAFISGLFYAFSGILITNTSAGHLNRLVSASLLPLVMYFLLLGVNKKSPFYFLFAGFTAGWQFLGGQFQMSYFSFFLYLPFFFYFIFSSKIDNFERLKLTFYAIIGVFLTLLLYSAYILPVIKNLALVARGTERGYDYASSWPLPPIETFDMIFINFAGYLDTYWGPNYFRLHHYYIGLFPFLFFIIAFFSKNKKHLVFFFIMFLITLTFAWGKSFFTHKLFYYFIPGVKKFRGPANIFFITTFCLVVISSIGLQYFSENMGERKIKYVFYSFISLFVLLLILFPSLKDVFKNMINSYHVTPQEITQKLFAFEKAMSLFRGNLFLLIFETLLVFFVFYFLKVKFSRDYLFIIFPLITFFESFLFLRPQFMKTIELKEYVSKDEVIDFLEKRDGEFRVFYFPGVYKHDNDGILTLYGIEDIGGYVGNPLQRFQDFIGAGKSVMFNPQNLIKNRELLNLLNVKYLILPPFPMDTSGLSERNKIIVKFLLNYTKGKELVFRGRENFIFENKEENGRFFARNKTYVAENKDEALSLLVDKNYGDSFAVIEKEYLPSDYKNFESDSLKFEYDIVEKKPDFYRIKVRMSENAILIFSMNYHSGWSVYIDGKREKTFPVNYTLTGALVPQGEHEVIFKFGSKYHYLGIFLTLLGYFTILLSLALLIFKR